METAHDRQRRYLPAALRRQVQADLAEILIEGITTDQPIRQWAEAKRNLVGLI